MPDMKAEKHKEVVSANETSDRKTTSWQDQNETVNETPVTKPAPGRLPACTSQS